MRRARERPEFGRCGRGISRVAGASAETWGDPHRRAQPFQTGSFVGEDNFRNTNEVDDLIGVLELEWVVARRFHGAAVRSGWVVRMGFGSPR